MIDVLDAVYDYVLEFTDTPAEILYKGYQNRMSLPSTTPDYAVIAIVGSVRHGTNTGETSVDENGNMVIKSMREYTINIDFSSYDQLVIQNRGGTLETLGRSSISVDFFADKDISFLYSDDLQYLPFTDDAKQLMHRYRLVVHLSVWETTAINKEYFDKVEMRIENVDVHHPK